MKPKKSTALSADWKVNLEKAEASSPSKDSGPNQILIFSDLVKDGAISASMSPIAGQPDPNLGHDFKECAILFRYNDREQFYLAGLGGFGMKFFVAKVSSSEWRLLDGTGQAGSLNFSETYHLRVEFTGQLIKLYHNDVPILKAVDGTHFSGFCGLRTNRTEAKFEKIDIQAIRPKCFVIMPFDAELAFVYDVIKETVEKNAMDCQRADERYIAEPIMEDVKSQIAGADVVVVDFTTKNPNVYFEAGLADAWKKKWIVLAQSTNDLAFDVQHIRTIIYSNRMGADSKLRDNLERALKETLGAAGSTTK
jgi:hypothetical protein